MNELCEICADNTKVVYREKGKVLLCPQLFKECPGFKPMRNNADGRMKG